MRYIRASVCALSHDRSGGRAWLEDEGPAHVAPQARRLDARPSFSKMRAAPLALEILEGVLPPYRRFVVDRCTTCACRPV